MPPSEQERPYQPRGKCAELWRCQAPEVLIAGPAGTGKSRADLEKLHWCAERYPGMRGLIVRKTRESCTESCLVTFETKVVPAGHPILADGGQRSHRQSYRYPNGSVIVIGGMDKPSKTLSTEYDMIVVSEAIELSEHDWEMLTRPLRNGIMPYQQIIGDTNPDAPSHWLKKRCEAGRTVMLESRHEDNPVYWDEAKKDWTPAGVKYVLGTLENMSGARRLRMRYGKWVQAEGVCYPGYDPAVHLIDRFQVPDTWARYWSVDFGYVNPFVWQLWAKDPDGALYLVKEIYFTNVLVEQHAKRILELAKREAGLTREVNHVGDLGRWAPHVIVTDHAAQERATLEKYLGCRVTPANKEEINKGIQSVAYRLKNEEQRKRGEKPGIYFMRDSLDAVDPVLRDDRKAPICTEGEFGGYIFKPPGLSANAAARVSLPDEPIDKDNHGMDAMRYMSCHFETWGQSVPDPELYAKMAKQTESGYDRHAPPITGNEAPDEDDGPGPVERSESVGRPKPGRWRNW